MISNGDGAWKQTPLWSSTESLIVLITMSVLFCQQTGCLLCLGSGWLKCPSVLGAEELLCCSALLPCGSSWHPASADPTRAPGERWEHPVLHIQSDWVRKNTPRAWDLIHISCSVGLVLPHLGHLLPPSVFALSEMTLVKAGIII